MRLLRNGSTPAVLLVHDGFADSSSWAGVVEVLAGLEVTAGRGRVARVAVPVAHHD